MSVCVQRLVAVWLLLGLCACASLQPCRNAPSSFEPNTLELPLLSPADLPVPFRLQQRITATFEGQSRSFSALLDANQTELSMTALGSFGQPLLTALWDGTSLQGSRLERLPDAITPAHILNDIQAAYWPCSAWRSVGYEMTCNAQSRTMRHHGVVVYEIALADGAVVLNNARYGYQLEIRSKPIGN